MARKKNLNLTTQLIIGVTGLVILIVGDRTNFTSKIPLLDTVLDKIFKENEE